LRLVFGKILLSMLSGIPGGIFAPSLSVGAGIGSTIGLLLGGDIALAALLGMAGYFAGVVQAAMTAFVIILEMTGNHDNVIPLMVSACRLRPSKEKGSGVPEPRSIRCLQKRQIERPA
jgi:H+/Cl- antiporter ClcA